jgi:hypothetical protein
VSDLSPAEVAALDARWRSRWTPAEVARRLEGIPTPWYVAGGWAVDLFLGEETREHGDTEIGIPAGRFPEVRERLDGYAFDAVGDGRIHEDAAPDVLESMYQTWVRDPATGDYLVDVFREPHDGDTWLCRHDRTVRLPYAEVVRRTPDGIPYLAPELALLFKSKAVRPKDQADFDALLPRLATGQRTRLRDLLAHVRPGHRWLAVLG